MKFSTSLFIAISALCFLTAFAAPAGHGLQARSLADLRAMAKTAKKTLKQVQKVATKAFAPKVPLTPFEQMKENAFEMAEKVKEVTAKAFKDVQNNPNVKAATKEMKKFAAKAQTDLKNVLS
jgi:hypothetical protein